MELSSFYFRKEHFIVKYKIQITSMGGIFVVCKEVIHVVFIVPGLIKLYVDDMTEPIFY